MSDDIAVTRRRFIRVASAGVASAGLGPAPARGHPPQLVVVVGEERRAGRRCRRVKHAQLWCNLLKVTDFYITTA